MLHHCSPRFPIHTSKGINTANTTICYSGASSSFSAPHSYRFIFFFTRTYLPREFRKSLAVAFFGRSLGANALNVLPRSLRFTLKAKFESTSITWHTAMHKIVVWYKDMLHLAQHFWRRFSSQLRRPIVPY